MSKSLKPVALVVAAVVALALAMGSSSFAAPAMKVSAGQVKKLVKKQIAKAAPSLSVAKAKQADTATSATTATTAATAANAQALGGKSLAQIQPVIAGAQNSSVVGDIGAGTDVVTLNYTLAAASKVNFSGVVELQGDGSGADSEGFCTIRNDGSTISLTFETTFDDIGDPATNPASNVVLTSSPTVAAGAHTAVLRCGASGTGPILKDDAALNLVAVPN